MSTQEYNVNGRGFGREFGDAQRFAMRSAAETGTDQNVCFAEKVLVTYARGKTGLALVKFAASY